MKKQEDVWEDNAFGYLMSNNQLCALYPDNTSVMIVPVNPPSSFLHVDDNNRVTEYSFEGPHDAHVTKKATALRAFYDHIVTEEGWDTADFTAEPVNEITRVIHRCGCKSENDTYAFLLLSNKSLQVRQPIFLGRGQFLIYQNLRIF